MTCCALDPTDLVFLFVDLQRSLVARSRTNSPEAIAAGAVALAEAAGLLAIPTLFSLVSVNGEGSQVLPPLEPYLTTGNGLTRRVAHPFMDQTLVAAIEATGRRTLVISGYSTEAAVPFAVLDAIEEGYRVIVALDACGGASERTEAAALRRIERAGGTATAVVDILLSSAPDLDTDQGKAVFGVVGRMMAAR